MLIKYLKKKFQERKKKKSMKKVISELKKLLEAKAISQEDYDLAISKLTDSKEEESSNDDSKQEEKKNNEASDEETQESEETSSETIDENSAEQTSDENQSLDDGTNDNQTTQENSNHQENDAMNLVLTKIAELETKINDLMQSQNEVDPTKPVDDEEFNKEESSDYGPGVRTVYSKK